MIIFTQTPSLIVHQLFGCFSAIVAARARRTRELIPAPSIPHDPKNLGHTQISMAQRRGFFGLVTFLRDFVYVASIVSTFSLTHMSRNAWQGPRNY